MATASVQFSKWKAPLSYEDFLACLKLPYQRISYSYKALCNDDVNPVCDLLEVNASLETLNLGNNFLGDQRAGLLFGALQLNTRLVELDLQGNEIGNLGAEALSRLLLKTTTLNKLNLNNNCIGTPGAEAIATSLGRNTSLSTLFIYRNQIGTVGAQKLLLALEQNESLTTLYLKENGVPVYVVEQIERKTRRNTQIQAGMERQALVEASRADVSRPWNRAKIMVVGQGKVGKSATVRALLSQKFDPEWDSTVGIDVSEANTSPTNTWHLAEETDHLTPFLSRVALERLEEQKLANREKKRTETKPSFVEMDRPIVVDQYDSDEDEEEDVDGEEEALYNQDVLMEAKGNMNKVVLSIWDFGGQQVFFTLHHLFLTEYGVYLIVFDLRAMMEDRENCLKYVQFWLSSVHLHAPYAPMLMVGTYMDEIDKDVCLPAANKALIDIVEDKDYGLVQAKDLVFFAITNKPSGDRENFRTMNLLRAAIEGVVAKQEYVKRPVSVRWIQSIDELSRLGQTKNIVSMKEIKATVGRVGLIDNEELADMLMFFHQLGLILHFQATLILSQSVILNPHWLVKAISKVIFDDEIHGNAQWYRLDKAGLAADGRKLVKEGIASRDLLDHLWDHEATDFLLDLMRRLLLLSSWNFDTVDQYLVPSMVSKESKDIPLSATDKSVSGVFTFEFLPNGVFQRLVCLCVSYSATNKLSPKPQLFKDKCVLYFGKLPVSLSLQDQNVNVRVDGNESAAAVFRILISMMQKINTDAMSSRLVWQLKVQVANEMLPLNQAKTRPEWSQLDGKSVGPRARNLDIDQFLKAV